MTIDEVKGHNINHGSHWQQKNGVLNLHFKKTMSSKVTKMTTKYGFPCEEFLKSLNWLQFIWTLVCKILQLQFQHLRHRWQNEKVTETMTRRSLYLWHDLFFQAMEIWEIKRICINWCEVFDDDVPCLKLNHKKSHLGCDHEGKFKLDFQTLWCHRRTHQKSHPWP